MTSKNLKSNELGKVFLNFPEFDVVMEDYEDKAEIISIHGIEIDVGNKQIILKKYY